MRIQFIPNCKRRESKNTRKAILINEIILLISDVKDKISNQVSVINFKDEAQNG